MRSFAMPLIVLLVGALLLGLPGAGIGADAIEESRVASPAALSNAEQTERPGAASRRDARASAIEVQAATTPAIGLSRTSGGAGTAVAVSGVGFPASASVSVRWDEQTLIRLRAGTDGAIHGELKIPSAIRGVHLVRAIAGTTISNAISFTVLAKVSMTPKTGIANSTVKVTLTGFATSERVQLHWVARGTTTTLKTVRASSVGGTSTTVRVPANAAPGAARVEAIGDRGNAAGATYTVLVATVATATFQPTPARTATATATATAVVTATRTATATRTPVPTASEPASTGAIWVDPVNGRDDRSGATRRTAVRTLAEAWSRLPMGAALTAPARILLVEGIYPEGTLPVYLESRYGTASAPISIESIDGRGKAVLGGDLNIYDTRYLALIDLAIVPDPPGDVLHCERCDHLTVSGSILSGGDRQAHETVKFNQSTNIVIENSDISGAGDNAIDFVAVQGGRVTGNRIHDADDWCFYVKGGSANIEIENNEIYNCGTGGFTAGQGTGFQFMTPPWLTYEAEHIDFTGNYIHDTDGAGLGVNGGHNILLADNRLERIGRRSHLLEIGFGSRSCDGRPGDLGRDRCAAYLTAGGWGTVAVDDGTNYVRIPNKNVTVRDNVFANPSGYQSQWQHLAIPGPYAGPEQIGSNAPSPAYADDGLVIAGNVIRNGSGAMSLGIGDGTGCQPSNATCNAAQLLRDNDINGA